MKKHKDVPCIIYTYIYIIHDTSLCFFFLENFHQRNVLMIIAFGNYLYLSTTILLAINSILDVTTVKQEISRSPVDLRINLNFSSNTTSIVTDTTDSINHELLFTSLVNYY